MSWALEQKKKLLDELSKVAKFAYDNDLYLALGFFLVKFVDLEKSIKDETEKGA